MHPRVYMIIGHTEIERIASGANLNETQFYVSVIQWTITVRYNVCL